MRLWSLHPRYLDQRGLVALWREALLAQAVLREQTKGYHRHPQLARFRAAPDPTAAIAAYLSEVWAEATRRGYRFDAAKIGAALPCGTLPVTDGQMAYEWRHLVHKLQRRAPEWLAALPKDPAPEAHPLFHVAPGGVEAWEVIAEP